MWVCEVPIPAGGVQPGLTGREGWGRCLGSQPADHGLQVALMKDITGASLAVTFPEEEERAEGEEAEAPPWPWAHRCCRSCARASGPH